jgi:hypothetical protein
MKVKTFIGTDAAGVDKQVNGWLAESKVQVRRTSTAFKRFRDRGKDALTGRTAPSTAEAAGLPQRRPRCPTPLQQSVAQLQTGALQRQKKWPS